MKFMDDVLSCKPFTDIIENTDCPWIVKGYLSAFLSMFYNWKQGRVSLTLKEFVEESAELFEHGLDNTHEIP